MKKMLISFMLSAMMLILPFTAFADEQITVNGESVKKGDTVTFEYYMGGISDPLEAAGAYIEFDPKALEYVDGSIGFDVFRNALYSIYNGSIYYSAIDVADGFDLKDEKLVVKLSFKVLDGAKGDIKITNTFDEIFTAVNEDEDLTSDDYSERIVTTVNTYDKNDAPFQGIDANKIEEYENSTETDFDNLMLGTDKEEFTSSVAAVSEASEDAEVSKVSSVGEDEVIISSETIETADVIVSESSVSTIEKPEEKTSSKNTVVLIAVIFVVIVAAGVASALIIKNKNKTA